MSTTDQEGSIERQQSQARPYAEKQGYRIVAEYADEVIAGDGFAKGPGLQRLLADARAGKFSVVVCDEPSRLSRQRPIDFIQDVAGPLDRAGVRLDTVTRGSVDWD